MPVSHLKLQTKKQKARHINENARKDILMAARFLHAARFFQVIGPKAMLCWGLLVILAGAEWRSRSPSWKRSEEVQKHVHEEQVELAPKWSFPTEEIPFPEFPGFPVKPVKRSSVAPALNDPTTLSWCAGILSTTSSESGEKKSVSKILTWAVPTLLRNTASWTQELIVVPSKNCIT